MTQSNIEELEKHLAKVFKGMFKSSELASAGRDAGRAIGRHVGDEVVGGGDSGYNYDQSGDFHKMIGEEGNNPDLKQTQNKLTIGVFELNNMNMGVYAKRNHQYQMHRIWDKDLHEEVNKRISLKAETQMPKWIIAQFGTGAGAGDVPQEFKINYTRRDKPYMYGPSIGPVMGEGGGSKRGFFKVTNETLVDLLGPNRSKQLDSHREHAGVRAGHVFTKGLDSAKAEIVEALADGIQSYLNNN